MDGSYGLQDSQLLEAAAPPVCGIEADEMTFTASTGKVVLLPATIKGMGRGARCEVLARRRKSGPGSLHYLYTYAAIVGAPDDFPRGVYAVRFDGRILTATYDGQRWTAHGQPRREWEPVAQAA